MALSNWDVLSVNHESKSTNGVFKTPLGISAEIYKDGLHIHDEKGWRENGGFVKDIVMVVREGRFQYLDLHVIASRGPDLFESSIYAACWSGWGSEGSPLTGMVGVGTYGFSRHEMEPAEEGGEKYPKWDGVRKYEIEFLKEMIARWEHNADLPALFKKLDFENALRFNKGDEFFAKALGTAIGATKPGEAQPTVMSHIIDGMKKEGKQGGSEKNEKGS